MSRTDVRKLEDLGGLSQADQISSLRSRMADLGGAPEQSVPEDVLDAGEISRVLPGGGLARRAITEFSDCPALIVELVAHISGSGGHVGIVGWPDLSLAGAAETGNLDNIVVVPDPGADPLGVASVLVEGLDLVISYTRTPVELTPSRARPLLGKLKQGKAALVLVGPRVASPVARVDAHVSTFRGIGAGTGRIRGVDVDVRVGTKTRQTSMVLSIGQPRRLKAV